MPDRMERELIHWFRSAGPFIIGKEARRRAGRMPWGAMLCSHRSTGLVALFLAFCTLAASPAVSEPALFVARDHDSSVYLYGTVHSLQPETDWRSYEAAAALGRSQSLWLETEREGDMSGVLDRLGFSEDHPLSERLSDVELEAVANLALELGIDYSRLDRMRPWLASTTLGAAAMRRDGYTALGVDLSLAGEAIAHGVTVAGLDTADEPIRLFADLDPEVERALLRSVVAELSSGTPTYRDLIPAWLRGDLSAVERIGHGPMRKADPRLYDTLIAERNRSWLPKIERLMLGQGEHFVAVGVLHVVGPDGLPRLLAERGYTVERVSAE